MAKTIIHADQCDLFREAVYPSRQPTQRIECSDLIHKLARAMSRALKECPYTRQEVAGRMADALGQASISASTLNAYTSEAKPDHQISLVRFVAFVRATEARWLWDLVVADEGLTMLEGDEARLAEIARVQQEVDLLKAHMRSLKARPVHVRRRARS